MKYQNGAFAFYTNRKKTAHDPQDVRQMATDKGQDPAIVPAYAGDRLAVARAISATNSGLERKGYELTSIKTTRHEVLYGISIIDRDTEHERVDFTFADRLRWSDENGNGEHITGDHAVCRQADDAYQTLRGKITPADWAQSITEYLQSTCQATPMREDGRIYWLPPMHVTRAQQFGELLNDVGIALIICEIEATDRVVVQQAANDSLYSKLEELEQEAEAFDGSQNPSTYKRRLQEYESLRQRATTYHDALNIGVDKAQSVLERLEREVGQMLDVRRKVTIKRDSAPSGTLAHVNGLQAVSVDQPALSF